MDAQLVEPQPNGGCGTSVDTPTKRPTRQSPRDYTLTTTDYTLTTTGEAGQ